MDSTEGTKETRRGFVSHCKQEGYMAWFVKWLKSSQFFGNLTFYRTSGFHRVFHSLWDFEKPQNPAYLLALTR